MDYRTAQKVADRPAAHTLMERSAAFTWAHRKAADRKVSADYRERCHAIAKMLWAEAGRAENAVQ